MDTPETKKYKNKTGRVLRFSLDKDEHTVRPGGTVTVNPNEPYIRGLVATGALEEKPEPQQTELALSGDPVSTDSTTPTAKSTTKAPANK